MWLVWCSRPFLETDVCPKNMAEQGMVGYARLIHYSESLTVQRVEESTVLIPCKGWKSQQRPLQRAEESTASPAKGGRVNGVDPLQRVEESTVSIPCKGWKSQQC